MNTTAIPADMKANVAAIERGERRATPHTPCPLVQPFPKRDPKPTSSPAKKSSGTEEVKVTCGCRTKAEINAAPEGNPIRKAAAWLQGTPDPLKPVARAAIPLTPAIRPLSKSKSPAAVPISAPPASATKIDKGFTELA